MSDRIVLPKEQGENPSPPTADLLRDISTQLFESDSASSSGASGPSSSGSDRSKLNQQDQINAGLSTDIYQSTGDRSVKQADSSEAPEKARPTVGQDLKTLTNPDARNSEVEEAGYRLVDKASSLADNESADGVISNLRSMAESESSNSREKREAAGLLLDTFEKLSAGGTGLNSDTVQDRIAKMGKTALRPLEELSRNNPEFMDTRNPEGKQIRRNADFLTGVIESEQKLKAVGRAVSGNPPQAERILNAMSDSAADMKSAKGLGVAGEMSRHVDEWKPGTDLRLALESALRKTTDTLLKDPSALKSDDIRERLRAVGPQAAGALQKIVDGNPEKNDNANPAGKLLREQAQEVIQNIAKDRAAKDLREVWQAFDTLSPKMTKAPESRLLERAGDIKNPLAEQTLKELNNWTHEWRPHSEHYKFAASILAKAVDKILSPENALANPATHSLLRAAGLPAALALEKIAGEKGPHAKAAQQIIQGIREDELQRKRREKS